MADLTKSIKEVVNEQLAAGESIEAEYTREAEFRDKIITTAVTERRVIECEGERQGRNEEISVKSYFIPDHRILGLSYEQEFEEPWYAPILRFFGLSTRSTETYTVGIKSSAESKEYEFQDEAGEPIARSIAQLAAHNQQ